MSWLQTPKQIGETIKNVGRLRKIVGVFVKNGFQDVAQKIRLHSFIGRKNQDKQISHLSTAQRVRLSFEELGPTFIKLGQLLANRPDIIPQDYVNEFRKLQDQIPPVDFSDVEKILETQFPQGYRSVFSEFGEKSIGSASIAQVHRAKLMDGTPVVVKIQKPGVAPIIEDDIRILQIIAGLCEDYIPESRVFNPVGMVSEFSRSISLETNFVVEANNIKRFQENFLDSPKIVIPEVFIEFCGPQVLVMEELEGRPMSDWEFLQSPDVDKNSLMQTGLHAYFSMVFKDGLFHGDLHGGNIFVLPENRLGFIDFGMVGRLSRRTRTSIASMFVSLTTEDYDRLAYEYVELAPFNQWTDRQALAQDLRSILSPFFGLNLKDVNMGKLLLESSKVAAKHHVVLPSELMIFFKSMVTIEGISRQLDDDFDLLPFANQFAAELLKTKISTKELFSDMSFQVKEWTSLLDSLPQEMRTHLRKINQPDYTQNFEVTNMSSLEEGVVGLGRQVYLGLTTGALILGGTGAMMFDHLQSFYGFPIISLVMYSLAALLFLRR